MKIAIKENVDGVVPLIGIDGPLVEVAIMKEKSRNKIMEYPLLSSPISCSIYMCRQI